MLTSYFGPLSIALCIFIISECIKALELLELRVPAYVALGANAQLTCLWALSPDEVLYSVKWYKDGKEFFRNVPRDIEPRRKFPLPGVNVEKSDPSGSRLILSAVVSETAGRYRCEVSGERPLFPTVSEHADMKVVVLPSAGPTITGLKSRYRPEDRVRVSCSSGPSRPACELLWYMNGEPAPTSAVLSPIHHVQDGLQITTLILDLQLNDQYFINNTIKVKCLATLVTLYWRSNEESAMLEKQKLHEILKASVQNKNDNNSRSPRAQANRSSRFTCSVLLLIILSLVHL